MITREDISQPDARAVTENDAPQRLIRNSNRSSTEDFPFEMASFHRCWWGHLAQRFDIPVKGNDLLIHRKKFAKGLLQLREVRVAGWNTAWNQALTPERLAELADLQRTSQWDYFRVRLRDCDDSPALSQHLNSLGYPLLRLPAPLQYAIDLSQGRDAYMKALSHNSRKSLKKKTRMAQALNPTLITIDQTDAIDAFMEELIQHHILYWDNKVGRSYLNEPAERQFLYHWATALHESGHLILERLLLGGKTANLSMGVKAGNLFYWLFTVNTGLYSEYAPGIVALNLRITQLAEQKIQLLNMGAGDYFYKRQSANRTFPCTDLIIINPDSWKGTLYYQWLKRKHCKTLDLRP